MYLTNTKVKAGNSYVLLFPYGYLIYVIRLTLFAHRLCEIFKFLNFFLGDRFPVCFQSRKKVSESYFPWTNLGGNK